MIHTDFVVCWQWAQVARHFINPPRSIETLAFYLRRPPTSLRPLERLHPLPHRLKLIRSIAFQELGQ